MRCGARITAPERAICARVLRFVGCSAGVPYLRYVDLEARTIEPAAPDMRSIPQGIDDLVALADRVVVRCGAEWFGLTRSLEGPPLRLTPDEIAAANERSCQIDLLGWNGDRRREEWSVPLADGNTVPLQVPGIESWGFTATLSPDRETIAVGGCTRPPRPRRSLSEALNAPREAEPWVLVLIDARSGDIRRCDGEFDNFCYPPAWSADSTYVTFGAPLQPTRLYLVDIARPSLEIVRFGRRHPPMPLLDAALLPL